MTGVRRGFSRGTFGNARSKRRWLREKTRVCCLAKLGRSLAVCWSRGKWEASEIPGPSPIGKKFGKSDFERSVIDASTGIRTLCSHSCERRVGERFV